MARKGRAGPQPQKAPSPRRSIREELNRAAFLTPAAAEREHFYPCAECGQQIDMRRLGDVLHHEQAEHQPIEADDDEPARLQFIPPLMPTLVDEPPEGDHWIHEIKHDGYRTQLIIEDGDARAFTRNGYDWSERYRPVVACARALPCSAALIEGEMIMQDKAGRSDFHALRAGIDREPQRLILMAFDLLHLDGQDLRKRPIEERRELLRRLLGANEPHRPIHFSEHVVGGGPSFFEAVEAMGLEGIVSKKLGSRYRSGPSHSWVKSKTFTEGELVLIGTSKGDRAPVALLARESDGELVYAGAAMVTLPQPARDQFWEAAERIRSPGPPLPMEPRKETGWVRPEMRLRVRTLRGEEMLRHATVTEITQLPKQPVVKANIRGGSKEPHFARPDFDAAAIAEYYERMAPVILPWIVNRPLNLVRCGARSCWFQRNVNHPKTEPGTFPPAIKRIPILQKNGKTEEYLYIEDEAGLRACLEAGVVEFHGWGSSIGNIERPDRLVIDFDPDEGLGFEPVREAAFLVRSAFERLGLKSFPLLSGGKGIHVVVPIEPAGEWDEVRGFALQFCQALAAAEPARFTVALPKAERRQRIFLDYLRNQRTSTAILPYSVRARTGMGVAAPVSWRELPKVQSAEEYTINEAAKLLRRAGSQALSSWGQAQQQLPI